jgi:Ca-activated chloride channel family protein
MLKLAGTFTLLLIGLLTAIGHAQAQAPPPSSALAPISAQDATVTTLKVDTRLVAVSAIVRNKIGAPVGGLTRGDFVLKQDGKPQQITYFSQGSSLPLTLALMVDTSGSQRNYIRDEIAAGAVFFRTMMKRPEDRAVLVQFDNTILQLAKMTSSVTTLEHALAYLSQSHSDYLTPGHFGGTLLYDAICAVSHMEFSDQMGRRAMVILTDGGDNGSRFDKKKAIEEAQRADIVIYSVYYSDGGGDEGVLKDLSKATGGREFEVGPQMTLEQIYASIAGDLRQQYEIGYVPPDPRPNKYHRIDLKPTDKRMIVQAREGYFTPR